MNVRTSWRWLLAALLLLGWVGVRPAHAVAASRLLYTADWARGFAGWQPLGERGWKAMAGILAYGNHAGAAELVSPYRPTGLRDFAVEAEIERIGDRGSSLAHPERGYGVFARGAGQQGADVAGGFFFGEASSSASYLYPQSGLDWGGSVLRGADVALHDGFNIFRLEVHGDHYALYENGVRTVQATVKGFQGDRVGVFTREYRIRVRSFHVIALPAQSVSGGLPAALLSGLPALDLRPKEAPSGFRKSFGEYYTNEEVAGERGVSVDSLRQSGRLLSYVVEYRQLLDRRHPDKGERAIDATVGAYRSPEGARADYDHLHGVYEGQRNHLTSPGKYGVADYLATYDFPFRGKLYSSYDLGFVRGTHRAAVTVYFVKGSVPAFQALQWLDAAARTIDTRFKTAG